MRRLLRPVFCAALFCLYPALVQAAAESEILGLFQRWQAAHGQRSGKALEGVYAPRLDYYGRAQTRERTLSAKQAFFARHPDFEQRIVAAPQIVPGDQEGRYEVRFVKQVRLDGRLRNYPGLLLAERAGPGDTWRFVGESDEITRYAVDPRYTPLARGRFAGTEADFAWVVAHAPNSAALCDEYEDCRCDLWSADARVPPNRWAVAPARCSASSAASTTAAASACNCCVPGGPAPGPSRRCWKSATASGCGCCRTSPPPGTMPRPNWCCTRPTPQPGRVLVTETAMDDEGDWSHRTRSEALRPVP